jgi:hypothetical protein
MKFLQTVVCAAGMPSFGQGRSDGAPETTHPLARNPRRRGVDCSAPAPPCGIGDVALLHCRASAGCRQGLSRI